MKKILAALFILTTLVFARISAADNINVGSKKFTESVILGEILVRLASASGAKVEHRAELGGTRILWNALLSGNIDIYPEYSGTLVEELLADVKANLKSSDDIVQALEKRGLRMSKPLGFNNTYALGVKRETAERLGLKNLSDLVKHPELKIGLSNEFKQRQDGWPHLVQVYGLPDIDVRGLDHDVAYRALQSNDIEVVDLYSTDAEIRYYDLVILKDDRNAFPVYDAVLLYRADLEQKAPGLIKEMRKLEGRIDEAKMVSLNARAKIDRVSASEVARRFLEEDLQISGEHVLNSMWQRVAQHSREHLMLVSESMAMAIAVAIPLGIVAANFSTLGRFILLVVGIIQTFPALALLVLLIRPLTAIGLPGIGDTPAIIALILYSLLPIVRNTHAGLVNISRNVRETSEVLGIPFWTRLARIDLPLALPYILAGIKTAAVTNVGFATLGALIGAGGFGQPILTGIRLDDYSIILEGALPSAMLAVATQLLFDLIEKRTLRNT